MRKQRKRFRLHLLAFILACALIWYSINPAPYTPARRRKAEDDECDAERREAEHAFTLAPKAPELYSFNQFYKSSDTAPSSFEDEDDFEWPEFIDG